MKKALLALMMAAILLVTCSCSLVEKDEAVDRATEIIKVGDYVHTKGEIKDATESYLNEYAYYYAMFGYSYDVTDADNIAEAQQYVIDSLIQEDVIAMKAAEMGITLTEEETAEATANADSTWESYKSSYQSTYLADTTLEGDELEAAIVAGMAEEGVTYDDLLESYTKSAITTKLEAEVVKDVTVTDEDLQAELDSRVESAKSTYESSLSSYGTSVNNGSTVYYRPAGYRMVKQILVKFTDEDQTAIDEASAALTEANTTVTNLETSLSDTGIEDVDAALADRSTVTDITEEQTALLDQLETAKATAAEAQAKVDEVTATAYANIDAKADEVIAKLAEPDADWDALTAEYNEDPGMQEGAATAATGYAVCEGMSGMDSAFVDAAFALTEVGQVSPKTAGSYGYYIVKYVSDVEEGPVTLDEVRDVLQEDVLSEKQSEYYSEQVEQWVEAANAKIDTAALKD